MLHEHCLEVAEDLEGRRGQLRKEVVLFSDTILRVEWGWKGGG